MGTAGQAEDIVKYFYQNPLRIRGELIVFTLSAAFNFLQVSNEKYNFMLCFMLSQDFLMQRMTKYEDPLPKIQLQPHIFLCEPQNIK